ncbi:MAG: hypothetical protein AAGG68_04660 [Bacteroidota bacterium]
MKTLMILFISVIGYFLPNPSINQVQLSGTANQNVLSFSIENQGSTTQTLNYTVTQDDLVLLRNGTTTLLTGMIENIELSASTGTHDYTLTVSLSTGGNKSFSLTY